MFCVPPVHVPARSPRTDSIQTHERGGRWRARASGQQRAQPAAAAEHASTAGPREAPASALPPCVAYEDDDLLVVNKPAGALLPPRFPPASRLHARADPARPVGGNSPPQAGSALPSINSAARPPPPGWATHAPAPFASEGVYDWLRSRDPRWARLAIIHRLDKETSGLLVFGAGLALLAPRASRPLPSNARGRPLSRAPRGRRRVVPTTTPARPPRTPQASPRLRTRASRSSSPRGRRTRRTRSSCPCPGAPGHPPAAAAAAAVLTAAARSSRGCSSSRRSPRVRRSAQRSAPSSPSLGRSLTALPRSPLGVREHRREGDAAAGRVGAGAVLHPAPGGGVRERGHGRQAGRGARAQPSSCSPTHLSCFARRATHVRACSRLSPPRRPPRRRMP